MYEAFDPVCFNARGATAYLDDDPLAGRSGWYAGAFLSAESDGRLHVSYRYQADLQMGQGDREARYLVSSDQVRPRAADGGC
jgi:hypothetical protein